MNVSIPKLKWPFSSIINPHRASAEEHTIKWLQTHNLLTNDADYELYRSQGFAYMTSRMFPYADKEILLPILDYCTLLFIVDDQVDQQDDNGLSDVNGFDRLAKFTAYITSLMRNKTRIPLTKGNELLAALTDCWLRLSTFCTEEWQNRLIGRYQETFEAAVWQLKNISNSYSPTVEEYLHYRPMFAGANIAVDLSLVADKIQLPDEVLNHPLLKRLHLLIQYLVCWANDLFSLSKELGNNYRADRHNLVFVMQDNYNLSLGDAVLKSADLFNQHTKEFMDISSDLPDFSRGINSEVERYIKSVAQVARGNIDWSEQETTRYTFSYTET
jgi:hypothetical protein